MKCDIGVAVFKGLVVCDKL